MTLARRAAGAAALALLVGLVGLVTAGPASAHAELQSSVPANGSRLDAAPDHLLLRFTESVELASTAVWLYDEDGNRIVTGEPELVGSVAGTEEPVAVRVTVPDLGAGRYHVRWHTLSSDDLHSTYGTLSFGVGDVVVPGDDGGSSGVGPAALGEAALRWVTFAGLAGVLGGWALMLLVGACAARRRLAAATVRSGWVALAAGASGWALVMVQLGPGRALASGYGVRSAVALGGLGLLVLAAAMLSDQVGGRRRVSRWDWALLLPVGTVAALGQSVTGHALAQGGGVWTVVVAAHVAATATWLGGVVLLGWLLGRSGAHRAAVPAGTVQRFAAVALPAVVVSAVTGLWLAGLLVPSVGAATGSGYGRTLVVKVLLVGAALALGGLNALRARGRGPLLAAAAGGGVRLEAVVLSVALAAAALLTAQSPPTSLRWAPTARPADLGTHTHRVADLVVSVEVGPNSPGSNFVTVGVFDTRRPAPAPVTAVRVAFDGVRHVAAKARPVGDFTWVAPTDGLDRSGPWRMTVTASRPGYRDAVTRFGWTLTAAPGTERGGAAIGGLLTAAGWLLLVAALLLVLVRRGGQLRATRGRGPVAAGSPPTAVTGPPRADEATRDPVGVG